MISLDPVCFYPLILHILIDWFIYYTTAKKRHITTANSVQLILNMKVWWSSTYLMLDRAERYKTVSAQDFLHQ